MQQRPLPLLLILTAVTTELFELPQISRISFLKRETQEKSCWASLNPPPEYR